jgi:hypothetical protein
MRVSKRRFEWRKLHFDVIDYITYRCFPPPWRVDKISGGHVVRDANGQAIAYVYSRADPTEAIQPARSAIAIAKTASNLVMPDLRSAVVGARRRGGLDIEHGRNGYATGDEGDHDGEGEK